MPRLSPTLLRYAHSIDPLLHRLLPACRDLHSARNELRWLREHALATAKSPRWRSEFRKLVTERARGRPLQYVIGNQPFGDLEILCEPGVLIPRPETESLTTHLATLLLSSHPRPEPPLHILDLCTGTGCISLLLASLLLPGYPSLSSSSSSSSKILGIDISPSSTTLALKNKAHNLNLHHLPPCPESAVTFLTDDIFNPAPDSDWTRREWDVLIANPPYVSPRGFDRMTAKSVRDWEPRAAVVPLGVGEGVGDLGAAGDEGVGDGFFPRLLEIAGVVNAGVVLFEVGDLAQARRVVGMVGERGEWEGCEIWRDWPGQGGARRCEQVEAGGKAIQVLGEGNGRAVLAWNGKGRQMLGKTPSSGIRSGRLS